LEAYLKKIQGLLATHPQRIFKPKEMARKLGVPKLQYQAFRELLKQAAREGKIAKHRGNNFSNLKTTKSIQGELHTKTQGYGFLITEEGQEDVFISRKNMGVALNKDIVEVQLYAQTTGKSLEGRVTKVIKRGRSQIVGTYQKKHKFGFVVPDDIKTQRDIFIPDDPNNKAKSGQKVVVKIVFWEDERANPEGKIIEVLGWANDPGVDVISLVKSFDLPMSFPSAVEAEADGIAETIPAHVIKNRLDLRAENCFTIDPIDAKDFDDAVSLSEMENGNFRLAVHIADVSHYVRPATKIDKEALKRGTSIYLVDRVVPMLPEKLSNKICSLRPHEDRLTFSCIMEVTPKGKVVKYQIAETVINSKRRFTYEEVQSIINSRKSAEPFAENIKEMHKLSKTLTADRAKLGSLDFDLPEVKVQLDANGAPIELKKVERLDSHRLVEEFMLLANRTVTEHVTIMLAKKGPVPPFVFRIHEEPLQEKMDDFRKFVKELGIPIDANKKITGKLLGSFMKSLKGRPEEKIVRVLMLRSMMKAKYDTENKGHFGLAFKNYTHFTSPIRRYPDLEIHRLLKEYQHPLDAASFKQKESHLSKMAQIASESEIKALEAERESIKMKKVEYMQRHLGDEFQGTVSGVVPFGVFVELNDLLVEGLVHISDLADDYYIHDPVNHRLVGETNQNSYCLGDQIHVRVVRVAVNERVIDFVLAKDKN